MTEVPEAVRRQALHPFAEMPPVPGFEKVEREQFVAWLHPMPMAQLVEPGALGPDDDIEATVAQARAIVRAHGRSLLIWMVDADRRWLGPRLEAVGLVNEDTPGFEATENAMALLEAPAGSAPADVTVVELDSYEAFVDSQRVVFEAFDVTTEMRDEMVRDLPKRYDEYTMPGNPMRQFNALIGGHVVGTAGAGIGPAGINLFGGSVLPSARGRGVYRALTTARWELAVALGIPALTIQAGRMSRPIAERLGFRFIDAVRVYVDDFGAGDR